MATDLLEQYNNLREENDRSEKRNRQQKDRLASLQKEVTVLESKIREKSKVPGGIRKQQGKQRHDMKHISILENQLHQDTIKFDEIMCSNKVYRKEIDHLLQQKSLLCNIGEKFNRQLAAQKNITEKLGERSALLLNQRSEAETRMLVVKKSIKNDTAKFNRRRMELKMLITRNTKRQTFLETKLKKIVPLEEDEDSKNRDKEQQCQNGVKKLEMYKQAHKTLVEVTGESDLRQIGLTLIQDEQENLSHVRYINELHDRRNTLKSKTEELKSDILSLEEQNRGLDEQNNSHLKDLELELDKYSCLSESLEKQCAEVQMTLDQLTTVISGLLDEIMPEAVVLNSDNIVHFTSLLEERIVNLLIQTTSVDDKQMESAPQDMSPDFDLLPEEEVGVEPACGKSSSCSLKSN